MQPSAFNLLLLSRHRTAPGTASTRSLIRVVLDPPNKFNISLGVTVTTWIWIFFLPKQMQRRQQSEWEKNSKIKHQEGNIFRNVSMNFKVTFKWNCSWRWFHQDILHTQINNVVHQCDPKRELAQSINIRADSRFWPTDLKNWNKMAQTNSIDEHFEIDPPPTQTANSNPHSSITQVRAERNWSDK